MAFQRHTYRQQWPASMVLNHSYQLYLEPESSRITFFDLPQEVFVEVFALLCKPLTKSELLFDDGMIYDWKVQPVTPFFLGSICKAWRFIVWSTPTLWDFLALSLSANQRRRSIQIELLQQWIAHSCGIPLSLHLTSDDFKNGAENWDRDPSELYRVLDTYAERWRFLEVVFPGGNFLYSNPNPILFQDLFTRNLPILDSLALRPPLGTGVAQGKVAIALSSAAAPLLRHVSLRSFYLTDVTLPWTQLLSFSTNLLSVDECMEILRRCSSLTHCRFTDLYCEPETFPLTGPVVLTHIKHFEADKSSASSVSELLEPCQCSCPMLQDLVIRLNSSTESTRHGPFKPLLSDISQFLSRSSSPFLRSLSLLNLESEEEQFGENSSLLIECLRATRSIEILHLSFTKANKEGLSQNFLLRFVPRMTIRRGEDALLPNLREFYYEGCFSCSPAILIDVLEYRFEGRDGKSVSQLKLASIITASSFALTKNDIIRVEELIKAGMDISISVGTCPK